MDAKQKKSEKKEGAEGGDKKDWAEMSDDEAADDGTAGAESKEAGEAPKEKEPELPKKVIPPTQKGTKNKQGDYIVEKFEIPDIRDEAKR